MATTRFDLTEAQWKLLEPHLPRSGRGGQWRDHRRVLNGVLWAVRTGAPWRDVPARYGPWQTVYERFNRWRRDGTWARLVAMLRTMLEDAAQIDWGVFFLDSTVVRASRAAAGAGKKGGPRSPRTTPWAARGAASPASSTC